MKKLALLLALAISTVACKKDANENVLPEINGTYQITVLENMEGETLNFPTLDSTGKVVITSELELEIVDDYQVRIIRKGIGYGSPYTDRLGVFEIRKGEGEYIVYQGGLYIGVVESDKLFLNFAGNSRNTMIKTIRATK